MPKMFRGIRPGADGVQSSRVAVCHDVSDLLRGDEHRVRPAQHGWVLALLSVKWS